MNERTRKIFDRTADVTGKAARMTGKVALWSVVAGAGLWLLGKAGEMEAEEEAKKPPILAKFDGQDDTYTAPFTTHGPWQICGKATSILRSGDNITTALPIYMIAQAAMGARLSILRQEYFTS